jgi:ribosomal protein L28
LGEFRDKGVLKLKMSATAIRVIKNYQYEKITPIV